MTACSAMMATTSCGETAALTRCRAAPASTKSSATRKKAAFAVRADALACAAGTDFVRSDSLDTLLPDCETLDTFDVQVGTVPNLSRDSAEFKMSCVDSASCSGTIQLRGADGQPYGSAAFVIVESAAPSVVTVPLNDAAITALGVGTIVQMSLILDDLSESGYRIFLHAGQVASG